MLTNSGDIRLSDLGIAKSLNEKGKAEQTDGVFGSPHFMAPEQARGLPMDHRSVLYSLGIMTYEMLTGHPPFENDDPFVVASARRIGDPKAPRAMNPAISIQLEEIVFRAFDPVHGEYLITTPNQEVLVFDRLATGNAEPIRRLKGRDFSPLIFWRKSRYLSPIDLVASWPTNLKEWNTRTASGRRLPSWSAWPRLWNVSW